MSHAWFSWPRKGSVDARHYVAGETLDPRVSISAADRDAGSPKLGDMIARNPDNHDDQWLIAADYFEKNYGIWTHSADPDSSK